VLCAVLCVGLAAGGCGTAARSVVRDERIAIVTTRGLYLWDGRRQPLRVSGLKTSPGESAIRLLVWSPDGHELAWMQERLTGVGEPQLTLRWFDVATHAERAWPLARSVGAPTALHAGAEGVTGYFPGVDGSESRLRHFGTKGEVSAVPLIIESDEALADDAGFISYGPTPNLGSYFLYRVGLDGSARGTTVAMRSSHPAEQALVDWVASPSGGALAAEQGDHTDGCGVGPASKVVVIDPRSAAESVYALPSGRRWRVVSLSYSATGVLLVVAADTTQACAAGRPNAEIPTTLFELSSGKLLPRAHRVLAAALSPSGTRAVVTGQWRLGNAPGEDFQSTLPVGPETLKVSTRILKLPGTPVSLAWAPGGTGG
jgi:hypothetical protein